MTAIDTPVIPAAATPSCTRADSASAVSFDELFSFINRAGGIPPGVTRDAVRDSFERLGQASPDLCRSIVVREGKDIVAHCSIVKRYTHTWTIQHNTSTKHDGHTALGMGRSALELVAEDPTAKFVHANYAICSSYSSRTIGGALSGINDGTKWGLAHRVYAAIRGVPAADHNQSIVIRPPCSHEDFAAAARIVAESEPSIFVAANDWSNSALPMNALTLAYQRQGLLRRRHLLLAHTGGAPIGFALAEVSSIGINVREDFSAARVWISGAAGCMSSAVRQALLNAVGKIYAAYGRDTWHLIVDYSDQESLPTTLYDEAPVRFVEAIAQREAIAELSSIWAQMGRTSASLRPAR